VNCRYPSGACGCVARGADGLWRIACDDRRDAPTFTSRDDASKAERARFGVNAEQYAQAQA
jgi:hypothetical protein